MKPFSICGHIVQPGEKQQILLEPNFSGYTMPATMICGVNEGKTLIVTAGIHSGEYPGVAAVIRLAGALDAAKINGRILLIHSVNTSGFWAKSPGYIPEDGANLNANYPGDPNGGVGARIADYFVKEIFPHADFLLDMHSGGGAEPLTPCLFYPVAAGERVREISLAAARALDIPLLVASTAKSGEYSYAAQMGVPGLLVERGGCNDCREEWIAAYERDLYLLLDHLGLAVLEQPQTVCQKKIYQKTIYLAAEEQGLWYPSVRENQRVSKGDRLGIVEDFFGNLLHEYLAEEDGTVFYYTCGLAIRPGNALVAYGVEGSVIKE